MKDDYSSERRSKPISFARWFLKHTEDNEVVLWFLCAFEMEYSSETTLKVAYEDYVYGIFLLKLVSSLDGRLK